MGDLIVIVRFGVVSGVVCDAVSVCAAGVLCGVCGVAGVAAVFELAAVFALSAGFFGAKKYDQPNRIAIDKTAAIRKRF